MARMSYKTPEAKKSILTDDMADEILDEISRPVKSAIEREAAARLNEKGKSTGITRDSFVIGPIKRSKDDVKYRDIEPKGLRPNGKKQKRKAEVAFVNEYGVPSKRMKARKFMEIAVFSQVSELQKIAQKVIDKYTDQML